MHRFGLLVAILAVLATALPPSFGFSGNPKPAPRVKQTATPRNVKKEKLVIGKLLWVFIARDFADGDPQEYLRLARAYDIDAVAIKVYDLELRLEQLDRKGNVIAFRYPEWFPFKHWSYKGERDDVRPFVRQLVELFHRDGRRVYTWSYNYCGRWYAREAQFAIESLHLGVDGHIFNAEVEAKGRYKRAKYLVQTVRRHIDSHCPERLLAWCTLDSPLKHPTIPWDEFQEGCDILMPQTYHLHPGDMDTPKGRVGWAYRHWLALEEYYRRKNRPELIKPIMPVCQAYRETFETVRVPPTDIVSFSNLVRGYFTGVAYYDGSHIGNEQLDAIRRSFGNYDEKLPYYRRWQARVKRLGILEASRPDLPKAKPRVATKGGSTPGPRPSVKRQSAKHPPVAVHRPAPKRPPVRPSRPTQPRPRTLSQAELRSWRTAQVAKAKALRAKFPADQLLRGFVVYLDPGHGLGGGGVAWSGCDCVVESRYVWDVAVRVSKYLRRRGAEVRFTVQNPTDQLGRIARYWHPSERVPPLVDLRLTAEPSPLASEELQRLSARAMAVRRSLKPGEASQAAFLSLHAEPPLVGSPGPTVYNWNAGTPPLVRALENALTVRGAGPALADGPAAAPPTMGLAVLDPRFNPLAARVVVNLGNPEQPRDRRRLTRWEGREALARRLAVGLTEYWKEVKKKR